MTIGNARTEQISRKRSVDSAAENVVGMVATEIGYAAKPVICVVSNRSTAAMQVETVDTGSVRIGPDVGVSGKNIHLRNILCFRSYTNKRCNGEQTHNELQLHNSSNELCVFCASARQNCA